MAQMIEISKKITNELPVVKVTDDIVVTVNNRKNTVLCTMAAYEEMQKKEDGNDAVNMRKMLEMLIGKKHADAIEELDLPLPEYTLVFETIMDVATGNYNTPIK
jgi:PHD/YefM family antitoxin component YafN of YafNO toxin-antitoxin module